MTSMDTRNVADIIAGLKRLLAEQLNGRVSADEIQESSSLEEDLGLDSVAIVELIGAIESTFDFEFQDADLRTSVFANVGTLAEAIARRVGVSA
jgi:acyl carrier protein